MLNKSLQENSIVTATEGPSKERILDIACLSWCTTGSRITPVLFKYTGEDGHIYTVKDIDISCCFDKDFNGLPGKVYDCQALLGGIRRSFSLIYYIAESRWSMQF